MKYFLMTIGLIFALVAAVIELSADSDTPWSHVLISITSILGAAIYRPGSAGNPGTYQDHQQIFAALAEQSLPMEELLTVLREEQIDRPYQSILGWMLIHRHLIISEGKVTIPNRTH